MSRPRQTRGSVDAYLGDDEVQHDIHYIATRGYEVELVRVVREHDGTEINVDDFLAAYAAERSMTPAAAEGALADRCREQARDREQAAYEDHCEREMDARRDR